jgi:molybdopterin-containing oxidoreductase family membrane subunit
MSERWRITARFSTADGLRAALKALREAGLRDYEVFSPYGLIEEEPLMARRGSVVRAFAVVGGLVGAAGGFALAILSAEIYSLIVGGKPPAAIIPYCIVGFELTILAVAIFAIVGLVMLARMRLTALPEQYDPGYSDATFGLHADCLPEQASTVAALLRKVGAEEVHER